MPETKINVGILGGGGALPPAGGKSFQINEDGNLDVTIPASTATFTREDIEMELSRETSSRDAYQEQLNFVQARVDDLQSQLDAFPAIEVVKEQ